MKYMWTHSTISSKLSALRAGELCEAKTEPLPQTPTPRSRALVDKSGPKELSPRGGWYFVPSAHAPLGLGLRPTRPGLRPPPTPNTS